MTDLSEREKLKLLMHEIRKGMEIPKGVSIHLEQATTYVTYACGCRGKVQFRPHHIHKIMTVTGLSFCETCGTCKAVPVKLNMYDEELEFNHSTKKRFDKKAEFGIDMPYKQFEGYFQLN